MPKQHLHILKICSCPCQAGPNRKHGFQHPFRKDEVGAVGVDRRLNFACMGLFRKALFHPADVFSRVPQHIVLRTDQQQLSPDVFDGNKLLRPDGVRRLGIVKQLAGVDHVTGAFALGGDTVPVVRVLIAKGHIGQRLAPV